MGSSNQVKVKALVKSQMAVKVPKREKRFKLAIGTSVGGGWHSPVVSPQCAKPAASDARAFAADGLHVLRPRMNDADGVGGDADGG